MKKFFLIFFVSVIFVSCASLKDDVFISSDLAETVQPELAELETKLVRQISKYDRVELDKISQTLNELLSAPSTDQKFLARVNALNADYYFLLGNTRRAKSFAETALKYNGIDEYAILTNAKCMNDAAALEYTNNMFDRFPSFHRIAAYMGHLHFKFEQYDLALVAFDASLPFLDQAYSEAYAQERHISYEKYSITSLAGTGGITPVAKEIINKDKIFLIDMTTLTNETTNVFNVITGNSKWKSSKIADRLLAAGWYRADALLTKDYSTRKDTAIFLWHLICGNDESKLSKYSNKYKTRTRSPIPDVPIGAVFFDAALAMIESDIMQLIDGRNFSPDDFVTGAEFYKYLQKAKDRK
ncbi:MAG: S-layer homology domain-containing protein [Treponemataceae bacterium]